jgi:hypothetical protein
MRYGKPEYQLGETRDGHKSKAVLPWVYRTGIMHRKTTFLLLSIIFLAFPILAGASSVGIQPSGITLSPKQQQLFKVNGSSSGVTWSVQPVGLGTISSTGLYTAPASRGTWSIALIYARTTAGSTFMTQVYLSPVGPLTNSANPSPTLNPAPSPSPSVNTGGQTPTGNPTPTPTPTVSVISISITPSAAYLQAGQSRQFTARVEGNQQQVQWSIRGAGRISNGLYSAPATVANDSLVTILATSLADPTKIATATVQLGPAISPSTSNGSATPTTSTVSVTIAPGSTTLLPGQSVQFHAAVGGTTNTAVTWLLAPPLGTLVNGRYTAPAKITAVQNIAITAVSLADTTKRSTVALVLKPTSNPVSPTTTPTVSLTLSPTSKSLTGGQSVTFTPTVNGTSNKNITWSVAPSVGTIVNGVYQAPAIVGSQQNITVTATSAADTTKKTTAIVTLLPIGVSVSPTAVSVGAGKSAGFGASVSGTSNTAVTWSLSPPVGTIVNGLYTAPATIGSLQTVVLKVASSADPTKAALAKITLTPGSSSDSAPSNTSQITMPIEVIGLDGTTTSKSFTIPSSANLSGQAHLWMQLHGIRYETEASLQVNASGWLPINSSTVTLLGNAKAYGGIGGGFSTLKMTMNLPAGTIKTGANTISFRFNQTDGRVSGFRVLAFNVQTADGLSLIPPATFVEDDPNTWQPPSTNASDIAAGETLWREASLTTPVSGGWKRILAHCSDCHAQDGRDLKYFNYSNNSIRARSIFHGLTAQQGDQIASYIRTLNVVNPGRPWNPPYQPGPGLDSRPVIDWAAGAGLDAVLDTDQEMVDALFPSGFLDSVFAATSRLNQREVPLSVQLPDWNQWLPGTHPMDAFGSDFTSNGYNTIYHTIRSKLNVLDPAAYVAQKGNMDAWFDAYYGLYVKKGTPIWKNPSLWTPSTVDAMYSLPQWGMVKTWELNNEFQLEGFGQNIFGPKANTRTWYSQLPFFTAPHMLLMPTGGVAGLRNGSKAVATYLSYVWYNLQLILNDSNGHQEDHHPVDWFYANGVVKDMGLLTSPQAGLQMMWLIKGLQVSQETGRGPELGIEGWQPMGVNQVGYLTTPDWDYAVWTGVDPATRGALFTGMLKAWLAQVKQFTPQQFYTGGWTTATTTPVPGGNAFGPFADWVWYSIPRFKFLGADPTVVSQYAQWAQTVWPNANWTADLNASCSAKIIQQIKCSQ